MFKLFSKKKEEHAEAPQASEQAVQSKHPEASALAAQFETEEFDILAVTGANGFGGGKEPGAQLWTATLPITAWREEDGPIHREDTCLVSLADDKLLEFLRRRAPRDSIIQARVRKGLKDNRFLLVGLPTPMMEPELKSILDEQVKEVSLWVDGLGTFVLNRSVNWFQADVQWLDQSIQFTYDRADEGDMRRAQDTALSLMSDQAGWDQKARAFAAGQLLDLANDWAQDGGCEEHDPEEITREEFMSRLELESIQTFPDGGFEFWFNDGALFWGHSIRVEGSLTQGFTNAQMEG